MYKVRHFVDIVAHNSSGKLTILQLENTEVGYLQGLLISILLQMSIIVTETRYSRISTVRS